MREFEDRFQTTLFDAHPGLKKHLGDGLLVLEDGRLKTTKRGAMLSRRRRTRLVVGGPQCSNRCRRNSPTI
ncbi:MAG: hypothetical protein MZU79_05955 [Anaerotruncus sp.]|nr:hypothetical protein [Anaerotruncus sp.]